MRASVYVDGFNLYYGLKRYEQRGKLYKWLDLDRLSRTLLPRDTLVRIRYFTALVTPRPNNPQQDIRQQTYIRALETIPHLAVHYGQFLTKTKMALLASPPATGSPFVRVVDVEEKGSDVNLATLMLCDGFAGDYELAVIISNDSDLKMPIDVVRQQLGLQVGVFNPHSNISATLHRAATFYKPIPERALQISQFPMTLADQHGVMTKPAAW